MRKIDGIPVNPGKRDKGATLWNIVRKYVEKNHPEVPIDGVGSAAGAWRFRIKVLKNEVEITDAGASPGQKAPEDFPRKIIRAADPKFFKKLSDAIKKGNVCVYRDALRKLKSTWKMEAAPDLMAIHGMDVEVQMIHGMAAEIQKEIDEAIIKDLLEPLDVGDVMSPKKKRKKK